MIVVPIIKDAIKITRMRGIRLATRNKYNFKFDKNKYYVFKMVKLNRNEFYHIRKYLYGHGFKMYKDGDDNNYLFLNKMRKR